MKKYLLAVTLLLLSFSFSFAQTSEVREIKITSTWGGLGDAQKSELIITQKSKGFYAKGKKIETQLVENLLKAINAPEIKQFNAENLGITQEWLNANAQSGVKEYADYYYSTAAPNQQSLYLTTFMNLQFIEEILPSVLRGGWTDDYPHFGLEIVKTDGNKMIVESNEQPTLMLPWKISRDDKEIETYNANISRAIVDLLPKKFANRSRLSGEDLRRVLATSVMRRIKEKWEFLEVENKAGNTLDNLKETYTVESAEINPYHGIDFGLEWGKDKPTETNLHLILSKVSFPKGFAISLKLPFQDGKVENLDVFQNKIDKYRDLVFSVSWLKNIIETNKQNVQLRFIKNRSFSAKAMQTFADDMNKIGKSEIIDEVEKEQENIALIGVGSGLEYYYSYWLILPSKKVILWRNGYNSLLNWKKEDFVSKVCSTYSSGTVQCIGAIISSDENIISK